MAPPRKSTTGWNGRAGSSSQASGGAVDLKAGLEDDFKMAAHTDEPRARRKQNAEAYWRKLGYYQSDSNVRSEGSRRKRDKLSKVHERGEITERYHLLVKPSKDRIMILQYPNRAVGETYSNGSGQRPIEMRIKPITGIVEVDVPLNVSSNFDKRKSLQFGSALKKSNVVKNGGSFGLSGGMGLTAPRPARTDHPDVASEAQSVDDMLDDFEKCRAEGLVMDKVTLGGRIVPLQDGDPMYMTAAYEGVNVTWRKIDAFVQLRPQMNHLDAITEQAKSASRQERNLDAKVKEEKVEDVSMAIRDTADNDNVDMYGGMSDTARLLRQMRDEPWQRLDWVDQADIASYRVYQESMTIQAGTKSTPMLVAEMSNQQYLDAVSYPRADPFVTGQKVMRRTDDSSSMDGFESQTDHSHFSITTDMNGDEQSDSSQEAVAKTYESIPRSILQPSGAIERNIERVCRLICLEPQGRRQGLLDSYTKSKSHKEQFAFLSADDQNHPYFRWRLDCNESGWGISPKEDHPSR